MSELTNKEKKEIKNELKNAQKQESQKDDWEYVIAEERSLYEKIAAVFWRFEFLALEPEQKESVVIQLKKDAQWNKLYWIVILLSWVIATLWLLHNSVAVVIGAMLIAPLLRPINGLSYAIARGGSKSFSQSARCLVFSILLPVVSAFFVTKLLWIYTETPEILARISPNILDFFIAAFSAAVAILSLRYKELWESIAGVALAASLMPPLAVIGIELAFGNIVSAFWAFTLFLANLWAIVCVSIVFLWLYGYTPHHLNLQKQSFQRVGVVIVSVCILLVPLYFSFVTIKQNAESIQQIHELFREDRAQFVYDYTLSEVYIKDGEKHVDIILKTLTGTDILAYTELLKKQLKQIFPDSEMSFSLEIRYIDSF